MKRLDYKKRLIGFDDLLRHILWPKVFDCLDACPVAGGVQVILDTFTPDAIVSFSGRKRLAHPPYIAIPQISKIDHIDPAIRDEVSCFLFLKMANVPETDFTHVEIPATALPAQQQLKGTAESVEKSIRRKADLLEFIFQQSARKIEAKFQDSLQWKIEYGTYLENRVRYLESVVGSIPRIVLRKEFPHKKAAGEKKAS